MSTLFNPTTLRKNSETKSEVTIPAIFKFKYSHHLIIIIAAVSPGFIRGLRVGARPIKNKKEYKPPNLNKVIIYVCVDHIEMVFYGV